MKNKKSEILAKIKESVFELDPNSELFLFGSQARNEEKEDSDWDILILSDKYFGLKGEQKYRHKLFEFELEYGIALSVFVYSKPEWKKKYYVTPFYKNIQREGIRI